MILARKFLIPASILFVLLAAGLFAVFSAELSFQLQAGELRQDGVLQQAFEARLQALEDLTESLAVQAAADPRIQAALAAADREALLAEVQPLVEAQSSSFPAGYTFHLPAAVEFLSTDGPEAAGEDPSQARSYIADAIAGNRTVQILDIGESGLAVLTVVPVVSRGQVVGSVTAGLPLGRALLDELKAVYGHEWQLYLAQDQAPAGLQGQLASGVPDPSQELVFFESTNPLPVFSPSDHYQRLLNQGTPQQGQTAAGETSFHLLSLPLKGYSGQVIAALDVVQDRSALIQERNSRLLAAGGAAAFAGLLACLACYFLLRRVYGPLDQVNQAASAIAAGNLSRRVELPQAAPEGSRQDEIVQLAGSLNQVADQVQTLVAELDSRVAARTAAAERRTEQIRTTAEVARDLSSARSLDELLDRAVDLIATRFGFYHAGVFLIDEQHTYAQLVAATGEAGRQMLAQGHRLRVGQVGLVGYVTSTGKPRVALDVEKDSYHYKNPLLPQTASELALPLRAANRLIGALDVQSTQPQAFQPEDVTVLQILADQFAAAIENIRLQERSEQAVAQARQAMQAQAASAWEGLRLRRQAPAYEFDGVRVKAAGRSLNEPTLAQLRQGHTVILRSSAGEPGPTGSSLLIPLRIQEQLVGVIGLDEQDPDHQWPLDVVMLAEAVAAHAAQTLENARLVEETQEMVRREHLLAEISGKMQRAASVESLVARTIADLQSALGADYAVVSLGSPDGAAD